jgi:hypothetical protein
LVAEVWEGSESGPSHLAEIKAEPRKLRGLRHDVDPRDALQIAAVLAPLARGFMLQPTCNPSASRDNGNMVWTGTTDMFTESRGLVQHIRAKGAPFVSVRSAPIDIKIRPLQDSPHQNLVGTILNTPDVKPAARKRRPNYSLAFKLSLAKRKRPEMCLRRLHHGQFVWPQADEQAWQLSEQQWQWLVTGVDWQRLSAGPPEQWRL